MKNGFYWCTVKDDDEKIPQICEILDEDEVWLFGVNEACVLDEVEIIEGPLAPPHEPRSRR